MAIFPTDVVQRGAVATRPAAGIAGRLFLVTDSGSQRLTYDDGAAWQDLYVDPNWAPGGAAQFKIATQTLAAPAAAITFSGIPATYSELVLVLVAASSAASTSADLVLQANGDTSANYDSVSSLSGGSSTTVATNAATAAPRVGQCPGSTAPANSASVTRISVPAYAGTAFLKSAWASTALAVATSGSAIVNYTAAWHWRSTAAINALRANPTAGNFVTGTTASLYGIL